MTYRTFSGHEKIAIRWPYHFSNALDEKVDNKGRQQFLFPETRSRGQRLAPARRLMLLLALLLVGQVGIAGGTTPAPTVSETFDGAACGVTARLWNPRIDSDVASDTSNWVPSSALDSDSFLHVDATMKQPQITVEVDQDIDANALLLLADPTDGELVSISFTTGTSLMFSVRAADPDFCDGYATRPRPHPGARAPCAAPRARALPSIPSAHAICIQFHLPLCFTSSLCLRPCTCAPDLLGPSHSASRKRHAG